MWYLSEFKARIEETNERTRKIDVLVEYKAHGDVSSELHEILLYKNADGIAVVESDIYDSHDKLEVYKLEDAEHVMKEIKELGLDPDDLDDVAEYMLYKKLTEIKEETEDDELIEKIDEELKKISFFISNFFHPLNEEKIN